jgi:hypothetical protein
MTGDVGITELVTGIIVALGGAKLVPMIINGIKAQRSNHAKEERQENRTLLGRAKYAEQRADLEAEFRRQIETWGGELEYMLTQLGVPRDRIPRRPARPQPAKETTS